MNRTALILHLQRLSTEDGPGLRTTVFFKGCSLRCEWCHNPESLSPHPQIQWLENRCIGCGTCLIACPRGYLTRTAKGLVINRALCQGCGTCAEACPAGALELLGTRVELDELIAKLLKDRSFFAVSGGGVTASGGEPALQAPFVAALFQRLQAEGVHTALDTSGACAASALETMLPYTDLVLYDLKEIDGEKHRRFTGQDNARILENVLLVRRWQLARGNTSPALWVRTPLIPGATATAENIAGIGRFIAEHLNSSVERWELCAFNNLCRDKYRRLGMTWAFADTTLLSEAEVAALADCARRSGVDPAIVVATGATRTPPAHESH